MEKVILNSTQQQEKHPLQKQAIDAACAAFASLPKSDPLFIQCIEGKESIIEVLRVVLQSSRLHKQKRATRVLENFQKYTLWLQNISSIVDIAVQTQAGIACPVWAPIKFILKVSSDHIESAERVLDMLQNIAECLPRFEIYEKLEHNNELGTAILRVFTDVVEFSIQASRYFRRRTIVRLTRVVGKTADQEFGPIMSSLKRHCKAVDQTAIAIELLRVSEHRKDSELKYQEENKMRCKSYLRPANMKEIHGRHLETRSAGTCQWIFSNETFRPWFSRDPMLKNHRIVCLSGGHGCGKSILSSSIVEGLEHNKQLVLSFTFSSTDAARGTLDNFIRTLLWQLLQICSSDEQIRVAQHIARDEPVIPEIWEIFYDILSGIDENLYLVVDGIDECREWDQLMADTFLRILERNAHAHVLLLGRPQVFQSLTQGMSEERSSISITPSMVAQDIEAFIRKELAQSNILSMPELHDEVFERLKVKSDGMFLWVRLMIDELRKSSSVFEVKERLRTLPYGLEDTYRLIFSQFIERLDQSELRIAKAALAFTICACRSLEVEEFQYMYALDLKSASQTPERPFVEYLILQPHQKILDICGGLLSLSNGSIRLHHSSLMEFLTRPEDKWLSTADQAIVEFRVDYLKAHKSFASLCIDCLSIRMNDSQLERSDHPALLQDPTPFSGYAAIFTIHHIYQSGEPCPIVMKKLSKLLGSRQGVTWVESFASHLMEDLSLESQLYELEYISKWTTDDVLIDLFIRFENACRKELKQRNRQSKPHSRADRLQLLINHLTAYRPINSDSIDNLEDSVSNIRLDAITEVSENEFRREVAAVKTATNATLVASEALPDEMSHLMKILEGNSISTADFQLEMILRLQKCLRKVRILTDPLKLLFRLILQRASDLPAYALMAIGHFYWRVGKTQESLEVWTAISKKLEGQDVVAKYIALSWVGECHFTLRNYKDALTYYQEAYAGTKRLLGEKSDTALSLLYDVANTHFWLWQSKDTLRCCEQLLGEKTRIQSFSIECNADIQYQIGRSYRDLGRPGKALSVFKRALSQWEQEPKAKRNVADYKSEIGYIYVQHGRINRGIEWLIKALEANRESYGAEDKNTFEVQSWLGYAYRRVGKLEESRKYLQEALTMERKVLGEGHSRSWAMEELELVEQLIADNRLSQHSLPMEYSSQNSSMSSFSSESDVSSDDSDHSPTVDAVVVR